MQMSKVQVGLVICLILSCLLCDWLLLQQTYFPRGFFFRHLIDSAGHATIGAFSWAIFLSYADSLRPPMLPLNRWIQEQERCSRLRPIILECLFAGFFASMLDIDHFIAAGAFTLNGATNLKSRPFGHAVTFIIALGIISWKCTTSLAKKVKLTCFIIDTLLSHQLRDGYRRGLWFWPFGSTPAIPYTIYLFLELILPFVLGQSEQQLTLRLENTRSIRVTVSRAQDEAETNDQESLLSQPIASSNRVRETTFDV